MPTLLDGTEFVRRIATVQNSAFRLELQRQYREPGEETSLTKYLAGEPGDPFEDLNGFRWIGIIRDIKNRGGQLERVRVHDTPPTDYQRWERWLGGWNIDAGEVIRYMTRDQAHEVGLLPAAGDIDWWLLDDTELITMHFDSNGNRIRTELGSDPDAVAQARVWRDLAVRHSVPDPGRTAA
jgi:hypothetical protein